MNKSSIVAAGLMLVLGAAAAFSQGNRYSVKSRKAIELYEQAVEAYNRGDLASAVDLFDGATAIEPAFAEAYFAKADILGDLGEYDEQFAAIARAVACDSTMYVTAYYHAGVALCNVGRFDDAMQWFDLYKRFSRNRRVKMNPDVWIAKAMAARRLIENPVDFVPVNAGDSINSPYDEYWPSLTLDESEMMFTVLVPRDSALFAGSRLLPRTSQNFQEDFYTSTRVDSVWMPRRPVVEINTPYNEGAQALSADGNWMFFTACGRDDSKGSCDLYFSSKTRSGWTQPINVGSPVNTPYWESQPCFSADGQTLFFVSNRPGGLGKNDIWYARIVGYAANGVPLFDTPVNLGDSVNTAGDEASPFIHPDGRTLYFSSDGWPGVGKKDIFVSRRDSAGWHTPQNIGYPINTARDETGLVINAAGTRAYFASEGIEHRGRGRDIYYFELPVAARPTPVSYLKGHVYDRRTSQPLGAAISLIRLADGVDQVRTASDEFNGQYMVSLPAGNDYALIVSREGYLFHSENFEMKQAAASSGPRIIDVYLSPLIPGEKVALRNVFFDTNSVELKEESCYELDKLVRIMTDRPNLVIEISGHTDNVGSAEYNRRLSADRARAAFDYLVSKGVPVRQLTHRGCGFDSPVESNDTEQGRARNRRIEAKVISVK